MAFATDVASVPITVGEMGLNDFFAMFRDNGYELRQSYLPDDPTSWTQAINAPRNETITTTLPPLSTVMPMVRRDERRSSKRTGPSGRRRVWMPRETGLGTVVSDRCGRRS